MSYLGPAFYRLEVHSFDHGIAVEEHEDLGGAFGVLDASGIRPRGPIAASEDGAVRFFGQTRDGEEVRIVLSHYARTAIVGALRQRVEQLVGELGETDA